VQELDHPDLVNDGFAIARLATAQAAAAAGETLACVMKVLI
jgi:hypothetical protein